MNHVTVFVPNVQKSVEFYQGLFGDADPHEAGCGHQPLDRHRLLRHLPRAGQRHAGSINHVCFGMENFDADAVLKQLTDAA